MTLARTLAKAIVADIFTTQGTRLQAQRLVLTIDTPTPRNLGGWGRGPLTDRIQRILQRHLMPKPTRKKR